MILDEYIKNRDVWRCPSAKMETSAGFINGYPDWLGHLKAHQGEWGDFHEWTITCPNVGAYPRGWGGDVTDSLDQGAMSWGFSDIAREKADVSGAKLFRKSINWNWTALWHDTFKLAMVEDPTNYVVFTDGSAEEGNIGPGNIAYSDICCVQAAYCSVIWDDDYWGWEDCAEDIASGCTAFPIFAGPKEFDNPALLASRARHLGGTNLGFLDGHASWWNSQRLLAKIREGKGQDMMGIPNQCGPTSWCILEETGKQWPTLY